MSLLGFSRFAAVVFLASSAASFAAAEDVKVADDLTMHYRVAGSGDQVILLVPGLTASGEVFERQLAHFQNSTDYTVYAIDPRGQGQSSKTATGNTYEQHGRDVAAFMQALSLKDVVLAGWSNGAFDVMAYVDQNTADNLRGLILIDGTPKCSGADNATEWVWYRRDDSDGYKQYYTQGFLHDRQNLNTAFATWMVENPTAEYLSWIDGIISQTPDEVAALLNETSAYLDYSEDLRGLEGKLPLLYVARTEWAPLVSGWAQANTPSATVEALGKHMMFWEKSEDFNAILDKYLVTVKN
ncbi:MAG: alpha/beta hydrolase [Paracoccaceae bacterium]|nr:alpha/beta hydrolase [Paracoccaceae bacterium]